MENRLISHILKIKFQNSLGRSALSVGASVDIDKLGLEAPYWLIDIDLDRRIYVAKVKCCVVPAPYRLALHRILVKRGERKRTCSAAKRKCRPYTGEDATYRVRGTLSATVQSCKDRSTAQLRFLHKNGGTCPPSCEQSVIDFVCWHIRSLLS